MFRILLLFTQSKKVRLRKNTDKKKGIKNNENRVGRFSDNPHQKGGARMDSIISFITNPLVMAFGFLHIANAIIKKH